jgi:hypothetical protein
MRAPSSYLTGLLHNPSFTPIYFESNHLTRGRYGPTRGNLHPMTSAPFRIASPWRKLLDAATCSPFLLGTSAWVLRPKPVKPATDDFETQTTKPPASSVLHTRPPLLDTCHRCPRPAVHQGHISTFCSQSPPWWVHCQHQHTNNLSKRKRRRGRESSPKWPKANEKPN